MEIFLAKYSDIFRLRENAMINVTTYINYDQNYDTTEKKYQHNIRRLKNRWQVKVNKMIV